VLEKFPRHAFCGFVYLVKHRPYPTPSGGDINIKQVTAASDWPPSGHIYFFRNINPSTYAEYPAKQESEANKQATISKGGANNLGDITNGWSQFNQINPHHQITQQNKRAQSTIKQPASISKGGEQSISKGAQ